MGSRSVKLVLWDSIGLMLKDLVCWKGQEIKAYMRLKPEGGKGGIRLKEYNKSSIGQAEGIRSSRGRTNRREIGIKGVYQRIKPMSYKSNPLAPNALLARSREFQARKDYTCDTPEVITW